MSRIIYDPSDSELMFVKMKDKSFSIEWKHTPMQNVEASKKS